MIVNVIVIVIVGDIISIIDVGIGSVIVIVSVIVVVIGSVIVFC